MSEPHRRARAPRTRRTTLSSVILVAGAVAVAAIVGATAQARSAATPSNSSPPTVSGAAVAGETLTATSGSWSGTAPITFAYAWLECNAAGASCSPIGGATGQTYLVASADIGSTLRVEVTATNAEGSAAAVSAQTAVVTAPSAPVNTAEPVVSGSTVEAATLTTTTGTWSGTEPIAFAYQWVRCGPDGGLPDGSDCAVIDGATTSSYVLTAADVGSRLRVRVTGSNGAGSQTVASNATSVVTASTTLGPPRNTVEPAISGTPTQGQFLTATRGTWVGAPTITFTQQWVRCGSDGGAPDASNCTTITGATSTSYLLTGDDVDFRIRVRVTATNASGVQTVASNPTATVQRTSAPRNLFAPSISGSPTTGQSLFASTGSWSGVPPITYAYQWLRCGNDGGGADGTGCAVVPGATTTVYAPVAADVGQRFRVRVTATNAGGSTIAVSAATAQVTAGTTTPTPTPGPATPNLPAGAIRLPDGKYSIPVTSVSLPERLVVEEARFTPNPVVSRQAPLTLRVRVLDTRGYVVRGVLVFARSTPVLTSPVGEQQTGSDGWATLQMTPRASFPLRSGFSVQFWIRVRKQGDEPLAGVSNRRLVQVATRG